MDASAETRTSRAATVTAPPSSTADEAMTEPPTSASCEASMSTRPPRSVIAPTSREPELRIAPAARAL